MNTWDPVVAVLFAVACAFFFALVTITTRRILVSPLQGMLSALVDAATALDSEPRHRGSERASPKASLRTPSSDESAPSQMGLGEAVRRLLAHIARAHLPPFGRSARNLGNDSLLGGAGRSRTSGGSERRLSARQVDVSRRSDGDGGDGEGGRTKRGGQRVTGEAATSRGLSASSQELALCPSADPGPQASPKSMRFTPAVMNKMLTAE